MRDAAAIKHLCARRGPAQRQNYCRHRRRRRHAAPLHCRLPVTAPRSFLLGRTLHKLEVVYDAIERTGHARPAIPMNLEGAVEHDYQAMYDSLNDEFGRLDGLLHNASPAGTTYTACAISRWRSGKNSCK